MTKNEAGPQTPQSKEPEIMKSLALGVVGDLGRFLQDEGLGQQPVKILEMIVFAMFVVTEAFITIKKGLEQAQESLDLFHEEMTEYIFMEYFYKDQKAQDVEELKARFNELQEMVNQRYQEYRQAFHEDYQNLDQGFKRTFTALADHLFQQAPPEGEEQDRLVAVFSVKLAQFWSGVMSSFEPGIEEEPPSGPA